MKLALLDIDGVLANDSARLHHALARDYSAYFAKAAMSADVMHTEGLALAEKLQAEGWTVAYLTGRREDRRVVTEDWLDQHGFPMGRLTMRTPEQGMPLANFKQEYMLKLLVTANYTDVVLFDDDPEVIRFVQETLGAVHGVHCTWQIKEKALIKLAKA